MSGVDDHNFGRWRSLFWPIHSFELRKILPMLLMMFCILFIYTLLRDTKDALVVVSAKEGAAVIAFVKVWGVVPSAILFMLCFSKLSNIMSKPVLFHSVVSFFLVFFTVFALVIYPNHDMVHPHRFSDWLQSMLPSGASGLVTMFRNWTFTLFYIFAELWGSVVLSLLYWGFANDVTSVKEAKRYYPLLGIGANLALIFSGGFIQFITNLNSHLPAAKRWQITLNYEVITILFLGAILMLAYQWMQVNVLTDARLYNPEERSSLKKSKPKLSLTESLNMILHSRYLFLVAMLVVGYGMSINLVEILWKQSVKQLYHSEVAYLNFMGKFSQATGVTAIFVMLFLGSNIIRTFGWRVAALTTPIVLGTTATLFFIFILGQNYLSGILFVGSPMLFAVILGAAQNVLSKCSKYALFDPTKEMAYIPLDQESKVKGKAAVDVVGARLGKSGGSVAQQLLQLLLGPGVFIAAPYLAVLVLFVIGAWIYSVIGLHKEFEALERKNEEEDEESSHRGEEASEEVGATASS